MRILKLSILFIILLATNSFSAWDASKPTDSEKFNVTPALIRANWDAIATGTDSALLITNAKVSPSAAIVDTKLATISTAGKVDGTAITNLPGVPAGAGALAIANGGSGQTTRAAAINALMPTQTSNSGKVAVTDGSDVSWGYPASLTIASAAQGDILYYTGSVWNRVAAGTSGQFLKTQGSGSAPAWSAVNVGIGTQTTGTLNIVNGGTGQTTANAALNALLPSQGSASGKYLTSNGTDSSWGTVSSPKVVAFSNATVSIANGNTSTSSSTTLSSSGDWASKKYSFIGEICESYLNCTGSSTNGTNQFKSGSSSTLIGAYIYAQTNGSSHQSFRSVISYNGGVSVSSNYGNGNSGTLTCQIQESGGNLVLTATRSIDIDSGSTTTNCEASGIIVREP